MVERVRSFPRRRALVAAVLVAGMLALTLGQATAQPVPQAINTDVFNAVSGRYAEGMRVELFEVKGGAFHSVSATTIDAAGRADLVTGRPLAVGQCELRFQLVDYFRSQGVAVGDPPHLDYEPVRFSVDAPAGHYRVPLICTPWSYSTYRGS
jgi:5-hydroxyisourate hydrolase-like protein (transthyretin family)